MKKSPNERAAWPRALAALAAAMLCGLAQAVVQAPGTVGPEDGDMSDIPYGQAGNVFELQPMLFVQGLGSANRPSSVVKLNPLLQFSFSVSGVGTGMMTIDYRVHNSSATESFNDFRFMLFTNPDGDQTLKDTLSEAWGAAAPGDPALREGRDFNPASTILSRFPVSNNLNEAPTPLDAACVAAAGCDATVGMQWNAPLVGPGQTFVVKAGLSDDLQTLSTRWVDVTAVNSADTALRLSGVVAVVPEPSSVLMLLAGLGLLAGLAQRRVRQ